MRSVRRLCLYFVFFGLACGDDRPRPPGGTIDGGSIIDSGQGACSTTVLTATCASSVNNCKAASPGDGEAHGVCWRAYGDCLVDAREGQADCLEADGNNAGAAVARCCGACSDERAECLASMGLEADTFECTRMTNACRQACNPTGSPCENDPI